MIYVKRLQYSLYAHQRFVTSTVPRISINMAMQKKDDRRERGPGHTGAFCVYKDVTDDLVSFHTISVQAFSISFWRPLVIFWDASTSQMGIICIRCFLLIFIVPILL